MRTPQFRQRFAGGAGGRIRCEGISATTAFVRSLHEGFVAGRPSWVSTCLARRTSGAPHHVLSYESSRQNLLESRNMLRFESGKVTLRESVRPPHTVHAY